MKIANSILSFLKSPYLLETYAPIKPKTFFILLVLTLAIIIPYALILEAAGMDQFDHKLEELLKANKWLVAILAIFLAPILEEPIFRLHLDLKKSSIWWGIGLSILILSEVWWPVALLLVYFIYLLYSVGKGNPPRLKYVIWISSTLFALVHMGNFTDFDYTKHFYWVPFLVGAQFAIGLVLGYIRLNHGMKWAIIFHGVYNAVLIIPAVYFYEG
jgi:membrane protease YdiL (CAAX protease family)